MDEYIYLKSWDIPDSKSYKVFHYNDVLIGDFIMLEDGFYYYWPVDKSGCWSSHVMRAIADKMDDLNREWDEVINNDPRIG